MKNRRINIEHKFKLRNSTFTEYDPDELINKVHRENQRYQRKRTTDEERINTLKDHRDYLSDLMEYEERGRVRDRFVSFDISLFVISSTSVS